jgi:hypothetical protein
MMGCMLWRQMKMIVLLVLIGAVVNSAISFYFCKNSKRPMAMVLNLRGPQAAQRPWPGPAPKDQRPWPAPTSYDVERSFGHTYSQVAGEPDPGKSGLQMQTDAYGWPLPSLVETSRWWPWNDPGWKSTEEQEAPLRPAWTGTLLNPLIFGLSAWLLLVVPPLAGRAIRACTRRAGVVVVRQATIALTLALVAAAINLPVATAFIVPRTRPMPMGTRFTGAAAASQAWPDRTPASQPRWPAPTSADVYRGFGRTCSDVRYSDLSQPSKNMHGMSTQQFGWPLRTLAKSDRWWDWDNPTWKTEERPELPLHVIWSGAVLNPLIVGLGIWLIAFAPRLISRAVRDRVRRRRHQCLNCGYPAVAGGVCPECGSAGDTPPVTSAPT